jgi:peptidoglycan/LPS O-acetylase OafA/YrhL
LAVDALRAIAAIMVLLVHSPLQVRTEPLALKLIFPFAAIGGTGVGLFLVISGFSIHLRWAARPDANHQFSLRGFWARRFWRLYPTCYAAMALSVLLVVLADGGRWFAEPSPWVFRPGGAQLWAQILLAVTVVGSSVVPLKYLPVAWSLALEEHIYFVYALLLRFVRRLRPLRLLAAAFALSVAWGVGVQALTTSVPPFQCLNQTEVTLVSRVFFQQLPARAFEWVLGLVAAEVFVGAIRLPRLLRRLEVGLGLMVVAAVLFRWPVLGLSLNGHAFLASDVVLNQLFGVGFFVILNAAVHWERTRDVGCLAPLRLLAGIGLASYSLYLLHPALLELLTPHLPPHGVSRAAAMLAMWLLIIGAAYSFYLAVERPFVARSRQAGQRPGRHAHPPRRWGLARRR